MNQDQPPKVAVVTGGHAFDVMGFYALWRALAPAVDAYPQHLDDFCAASAEARAAYDVVLFYTMLRDNPTDEGMPWYAGRQLSALDELGRRPQGIVILHHALLGYPDWAPWREITGLSNLSFGYHIGETVTSVIADPDHPITRGLDNWTMVDETYTTADAGPGNHLLVTYDHPRSLRTIAWTRTWRESRVFCYQAGHDDRAWSHPSFRALLRQGICWTAGRL
ncbi:MAG: ThuA domain-containing protein [Armatimonadetes bacterium]|nr:ThuA domain-containing protein [Armatimonadota bacterium]